MLRRFLRNTAISAAAYGIAGVLGLFAVGVIARSYGLSVLGLVVLARAFLPTGFLALVDLGVSETTTQAVARGRIGDWRVANERVSLLGMIAAVTGIASSLILWAAGSFLTGIFRVPPEQITAFISILHVTAVVLPICFLGLVVEGFLKGFEYYGWLRATEVGSNLIYVAIIYVLSSSGADFEWLAYAYLATVVGKYLVLAIIVCQAGQCVSMRIGLWSAPVRRDILHRCWLMFNSRIGGTLQQPVPPLVIGALFGPTEVGTFDLITRLPRFLKATMAPLYAAILPISTRLDETTDERRFQMLGRSGLILPSALLVPALVVVATFSKDILRIWVGPQYAGQWPWLALSLCIPAVTAILGSGQTALIVRSSYLRLSTRLIYWQVFTQYAISFVFLFWLREAAFIVGWAVSYVLFAPLFACYMLAEIGLPNALFWLHLTKLAIVAIILVIAVLIYEQISAPTNLISLMLVGGLASTLAWILSFGIVLSRSDRAMFRKFAQATIPIPRYISSKISRLVSDQD
ncbi:MAG: teichoic acid transporter [Proteobacteria bacterium]|nr:teichoic acid transporter [Pseudomonadota bacterium]